MKKILFGFLIVLLSGLINAQLYHPFPDSNAVWSIATIEMGSYTKIIKYGIIGDTVINSKFYKKIGKSLDTNSFNPNNSTYFCAVRDFDKKWYFVQKNDTSENILYNFTAEVGDTILINNPWAIGNVPVKIISIDSILILNKYRKKYNTNSLSGGFPEQWIEGIGCNNGLFFSAFYLFDLGYQLFCFNLNDTLYYQNVPPNLDCDHVSNINEYLKMNKKCEIFPNPCNNNITIKINESIKVNSKYNCEIFSTSFNMLLSESMAFENNIAKIDISKLNKGIYFIIINNEDEIFINKIIKL